MYCTSCGSPRPDAAPTCPNCGTPVVHAPALPPVENYLVPAILVTLCCCLPGGIVAIVYAAQVNSRLAGGDISGAMNASRNAKMWSWISAAAGLLLGLGYGVVTAIGIAGSN